MSIFNVINWREIPCSYQQKFLIKGVICMAQERQPDHCDQPIVPFWSAAQKTFDFLWGLILGKQGCIDTLYFYFCLHSFPFFSGMMNEKLDARKKLKTQ